MPSPVDMVHRHLECLKFVGGERELPPPAGRMVPSGQGLEVGVVLLPDLILDVREYNFKTSKPIFAVGGRAARMASALLHLLGEDDSTFQVYLLTRTGNLGRLLLENELGIGSPRRSLSNPFLEYVLLRDGQPRCAIRKELGLSVHSSPPTRDTELLPDHLKAPEVLQIVRKAARSASRPSRHLIVTSC